MVLFSNGKLTVRHLVSSDALSLVKWLNDERVLEFYEGRDRPHDLKMVQDVFLSKQGNPVYGCMVEYECQPIGYIQYYSVESEEKNELGYDTTELIYGIDQFIGEPGLWNQGIGTLLVTSMVDYLFNHHSATRIILDPQVRNQRAVRCYEKCGFTRVRILCNHELHEGAMQDCWLMDKGR